MIVKGKKMSKIIKSCPLCGKDIVVSVLCQYSLDYKIRKNGKISTKFKKTECGGIGCSVASCEDYENCDARWEENEFFIDEEGQFVDEKYCKEGTEE